MHALVNIAVRAARRAGDAIIRNINRLDSIRVSSKGRNDFVSEVDHLAEQEIIQTVRKSYPDHAFLAEESGKSGDSEFVWIIDPLDGTTNFLHGFPTFAVSVAVEHSGRIEHGVVYDPLRQELFTASRGAGAQLDGRRIRVSQARTLESCLVGTGFPFRGGSEDLDAYMPMLRAMIEATEGVRRPGAAALDLAYVAAGRLDGFWEMGLSPWDVAAGGLLIQEAGGRVGDMNGGDDWLYSGHIVAGNLRIFDALVATLGPHRPERLKGG
jgi:myo-inositol-1(or 4)-monophosphatase